MKTRFRHILRSFSLVLLCHAFFIAPVHAQEKVTLQLKWTHAFQFAGYYAALEKGYYHDAGLDVTIIEANPDTDPVNEVLEGKAQYAVGSSGLLLSRAAGKPVVVLAVIFQHSPYEIYATPDIHHLHDLIGKRMMLEPQSEEIIAFLKKEGIPLDSLKLLPHTFSADALINGQTEAMSGYISSEPYFFGLAKYPYQTFSPQSAGIDFYGDNLFTSAQELAKFPERVKAFRKASLKGWLYAKDHRDEIIDLIYTKYPKSNTLDYLQFESKRMIPLLQPDLVDIGYMNQNRWKHIAKTYTGIGLLKADFSLEGFIYNPDERNLTGLYLTLGLAFLIIFVVSAVALYIFRVKQRLAQSIKKIRQTDEFLAESEASYHGLFNSVTDAIYIQDENGYFINVNVGVEKMYGYSRDEIIGHTPEILSAPDLNDLPKINELIKKTFITGEPQVFEFWGKRKNGEIFPKEVICNKGRHFGKDVIITTARDVTERKKTEAALHETNTMYNDLVRLIPVGIYRIRIKADETVNFEYGSEKFCKMLNLGKQEVINNPEAVFGTIHPDDRASLDEANRQAAKYLQPFRWEGRCRINGENGWLRIEAEPTILPNGDSLWNGVIIDITNRKRTEGTLRETNAYLENLINYANAPIIVWDAHFRITRFNHAFEHITGRTEAEVIGHSLELLFPPNLAGETMAQIHKTLTGERWETVEIEILHRDNSIRTVLWNSATIFATDGKTPIATIAQGQDITGRKQTEEKLRNLFENAPIGIFHSLPGGTFITTNPPLAKMLGYSSPEELVELTSDITTQIYADPDFRQHILKQLLKTDGWVHLDEVLWRRKDGSFINVDMTGRRVLNPDGSIAYLEGFIKDITEQKQAEMLLRDSEEKFREMANLLPQIIFETDLQGKLTYVNKQAYKIMGYDENDQVIGLSSLEFHIPEERPRAISNIQQKITGKTLETSEFSMQRKDGSTFPAIVYSNHYLINGKTAGLRGLIVDISDIKKAQNSLKETNAYLENLINYANAPIIVWDPQFRITRFNHAFEYLTGLKEAEIIGQSLELLFPPNHASKAMEQIRKTLTGERWETVEIEILHRNNSTRTVLWNSATIFAGDGKTPVATIAQGQDITERKKAEQEIKLKNEELSELNATKDKFFSIIAHDLKNPFNSILGFSELLKDEARDLDYNSIIQYSGIIHSSAQHTYELLESLLEWARMQQGRIPFEPRTLLLNDLIDFEFEGQKIYADQKNIRLINAVHENLIVSVDENMISTVVRNLISNAIKFTHKNGKVELTATTKDKVIEISVTDSGVGISADALDKLFKIETSFSTRGTENEKGTGLGLLLCKEFVEIHGGRIWAESPDSYRGDGSTFYFTIPFGDKS